MELEELKKELKELKKEFNELAKIINKEVPSARWRASFDEIYYLICSDGVINTTSERRDDIDKELYELGNYFQTEEEAEKVLEKIKVYIQLKDLALKLNNGEKIDWQDDCQNKYCIVCDTYWSKKLDYMYAKSTRDIGQIYCLDKDFLNKAIKEIGEENLKKLFE